MRSLGQFWLFYLFFLRENFTRTKKHKKHRKAQKAQNVKQATFFLLDVFYAHKNAAFFVFVRLDNFKLLCFFLQENFTHKKKHKKHKKHKNANKWISNFFRLRCCLSYKNAACFVFGCLYAFLCFLCVWNLF